MPFGTLLFLVLVIGLLLFTNTREQPQTITGDPADYSRVPWFLRYNAPSRDPGARHVLPVLAVQVATAPLAEPASNVIANIQDRLV